MKGCALFFWVVIAHGQPPVINSVQNAASLTGGPVAPQMLVTIKGQNLATTTETATFPWPTQFGGTSVKFGFYSHAAIYSVSPTQINVIVPGDDSSLFPDGPLIGFSSLLLTTASGSASAGLIGYHSALGIFTQDMSGCGQPAAYNIHADGSLSLNTPQNSLDPVNDFGLAIWLTGLGRFADRIDGAPWQYNPVDNTAGSFLKAIVGFPDNLPNVRTDVEPFVIVYAGPAPGLSGVDQVNLTFPSQPSLLLDSSTARVRHQGCHVPLYLTDNSYSASQLVSVSIKDGGGACVDPAPSSLGTVNWQKTLVSDTNGLSSSDGVSAMFWKGAWIDFPAPPQDGSFHYSFGPYEFGPPTPQPTVCPSLSPVTLDVGPIAVTGPASLSLVASNSGSFINYAASLPKGTITGGTRSAVTVSAIPRVYRRPSLSQPISRRERR